MKERSLKLKPKVVKGLKKRKKPAAISIAEDKTVVPHSSESSQTMKRLFELKGGDLSRVLAYLSKRDSTLADMISTLGPPKSLVASPNQHDAFTSLVKSVVGQQLSGKAAASIYKRLEEACGCGSVGSSSIISPEKIRSLNTQELRAVGLSGRKSQYVVDIAEHFVSGELSDANLKSMTDSEVMEALIKVRGIGEWTVHMFLMFHLGSPDVLPHGDLGVKKGAHAMYKGHHIDKTTPNTVKKQELEQIAAQWRPYRSIGSWYMWQYQKYILGEPL